MMAVDSEAGGSSGRGEGGNDRGDTVRGSEGQVEVLMATHNGEKYLSSQIESILAQDYSNVLLTIFDDGSTDGTIRCIEQHVGGGADVGGGRRVRLVGSERIGLPEVFFHLLSFVDPQSRYIGYADQDDLWLPGKVSRAVRFLGTLPEGEPGMYCSRVFIADERLEVTGVTPIPERGASFANALVQGIAPGSTMLFNRKAANLLASFTPRDSPMHDWWTYLVISATGNVLYDALPSLLYRQHSANARGVGDNGRWSWRKRILWHFQEGAHSSTRQAAELREWLDSGAGAGGKGEDGADGAGENGADIAHTGIVAHPGAITELSDFLNSQDRLVSRLHYISSGKAHRQRKVDDLVMRALYLLGRI